MTLKPLLNPCEKFLKTSQYQWTITKIAQKQTRGTLISWEDAKQMADCKILIATRKGKFYQGDLEQFCHWAALVAKHEIQRMVIAEKAKQSCCQSLDRNLPGTDFSLSEAIADPYNLFDSLEYADLVLKAVESIVELDKSHPECGYLRLWEGLKQGKTQSQIAAELGVKQPEISKRRQQMIQQIAQNLGLFCRRSDTQS
ncbi:MAG: sigma-70 family RNA polymerase sigma factor [Calothrix sp. C42_A2020_038]|nr:sigma-70 family RNA polymerase sigma factor [Calothrix sp. C42_A2020_038]